MKSLLWVGENEFLLEGVRFLCVQGDYSLKTDSHRLMLLKDREILGKYASAFGETAPQNVFEFGVFQGGSPALFTLWFELQKFVGVDVSPPVAEFDSFVRNRKLTERIRIHYGVSQADGDRIRSIVHQEFGDTPLDMVIDDASHRYSTTRKAFEIAFPLLKPGGSYVIEDWGWAHWREFTAWQGQTALSKLVMELTMLCASRQDIVSEIQIFPWFVVVKKSARAPALDRMSLDTLIRKRGVEIVGSGDLNLAGVAKMILSRLTNSVRRR